MKSSHENRPLLIKLKFTTLDFILESLTISGILITWIIPAILFKEFPDIIPIHFGINGEANGWGSKASIFILPSISLILVIGLSIINKFPRIFNYPVKVTECNANQLYTKATRLIRMVKVFIVLMFLLIEWQVCHVSENSIFPSYFLPLVLIIPVLLPIFMALTLTRKASSGRQR